MASLQAQVDAASLRIARLEAALRKARDLLRSGSRDDEYCVFCGSTRGPKGIDHYADCNGVALLAEIDAALGNPAKPEGA
jgi:hypothetical protein